MNVIDASRDNEEYAFEIIKVKEIILLEGITKVPQIPDFIEGTINLRGTVIAVLDPRKRFKLPCPATDDHTRIIVVRLGSRIIGLTVDSVSQVMKIPKPDIQNPPKTIAGIAFSRIPLPLRLWRRA